VDNINNMEMIDKDLVYAINGAAMEVHSQLGCGFLEAVYQEALSIELTHRGIPFEREKEICIRYKGAVLEKRYYADFVCYDKVIVELKAISELTSTHVAQVLNYLKATGYRVGLLMNFGETSYTFKRIVL
jgi:GxxExxY protein